MEGKLRAAKSRPKSHDVFGETTDKKKKFKTAMMKIFTRKEIFIVVRIKRESIGGGLETANGMT